MVCRPRRNHSDEFKAKVALAAIKSEQILAEIISEFDIHQKQILDRKNQLVAVSMQIFSIHKKENEPQK